MATSKSQSSLLHTPRPGSNLPEWSVSEASKLVKKSIEENFGLVRIRGEISELKVPGSGHMYLTLKDDEAILASVCWRGQASQLGLKPEIGMEVVATGRLTTYMGQSKYQLIIESLALAGIGALLKMLEERKKKLALEGLFDASRKRPLPYLPQAIGVITSPTGAVIRDILHRLSDRFPRSVLIWPVAVQGVGAAEQIAAAIEGFNNLPSEGPLSKPDVLIVARGGGSVEDLMPFNEEIVVRAAAKSKIPLISAVGHETDVTLIDLASDVRAPTPSAAAEMAVPVRDELVTLVTDHGTRLHQAMRRLTQDRFELLSMLGRALGDPLRMLEPLLQRFDERSERINLAWQSYFERYTSRVAEAVGKLRHPRDLLELARERLIHLDHQMVTLWREIYLEGLHRTDTLGALLNNLSPKAVLGRGYAIVSNADGTVITNSSMTTVNDLITVEFQDGNIQAVVKDKK